MSTSRNRIRQARRHAALTQAALAELVGVHRSAVAQWERPGGTTPLVEHLARIAICCKVGFDWLATGRGRMGFAGDFVQPDSDAVVILEFSAQTEVEARLLAAARKVGGSQLDAILQLAEALATERRRTMRRRVPYSR